MSTRSKIMVGAMAALLIASVPSLAAEPRASSPAVTPAAAQPAAGAAHKAARSPSTKKPSAAASADAVRSGAAAPSTAAGDQASGKGTTGRGGKALDRIDLDATQITGNKELPKVMYVVPWKRPDLGDYAGRPPNSLLDEILQPVDRDVFKRQNRYYAALQPDLAASGATGAAGAGNAGQGTAATAHGDAGAAAGNAGDNGASTAPAPSSGGVEK